MSHYVPQDCAVVESALSSSSADPAILSTTYRPEYLCFNLQAQCINQHFLSMNVDAKSIQANGSSAVHFCQSSAEQTAHAHQCQWHCS